MQIGKFLAGLDGLDTNNRFAFPLLCKGMLLDPLSNSMNHVWKAIIWLHNAPMRRVFLLSARIKKPRRVFYYNPELLSVFKEMEIARALAETSKEEEIARAKEAAIKHELESRKTVRKYKSRRAVKN